MPTTAADSPTSDGSYLRGSGGVDIDTRRVVIVILAFCVVALAVVAVASLVGASTQNSRQSELQRHGVPVQITVTRCLAIGSGIGETITYYACHGTYTLDGRRFEAQIGGSRVDHAVGQTLAGVAVPGDPSLLSTATAVAHKFSRWTPYITPLILAVVAVALAGALVWVVRRPRVAKRDPLGVRRAPTG